jgi:hypothetical protein
MIEMGNLKKHFRENVSLYNSRKVGKQLKVLSNES